MRILAPQDYAALPGLDPPAAYICVIRDIDRDRYRIEATPSPQALLDAVVAERERGFGIELISIVQADDLDASEAALFARHHARLSGEWLALDAHQLEELRESALRTDAFASHYLMVDEPAGVAGARYRPNRASAAAQRSARLAGGARADRRLAGQAYGYSALAQRRRRRESAVHGSALRPMPARQAIANWIDDQFTRNPIPIFGVFVIIALVCFGWIRDRELLYRTVNRTHTVVVESPTAFPERLASGLAAGPVYTIAQDAPVYRCASIACRRPAVLAKGVQIRALEAVNGVVFNGSKVWIKFQLHGEAAFLPVSYLAPLE